MTDLKFTTETFFCVQDYDIEQFIKQHYNHDFSVSSDQEASNDTEHSFNVKKETLNKWDQETLNNFIKEGRDGHSLRVILTDLANKDLIPEGTYLISVSW